MKFIRSWQDSNLRSQRESDFKSDALTARPQLLMEMYKVVDECELYAFYQIIRRLTCEAGLYLQVTAPIRMMGRTRMQFHRLERK